MMRSNDIRWYNKTLRSSAFYLKNQGNIIIIGGGGGGGAFREGEKKKSWLLEKNKENKRFGRERYKFCGWRRGGSGSRDFLFFHTRVRPLAVGYSPGCFSPDSHRHGTSGWITERRKGRLHMARGRGQERVCSEILRKKIEKEDGEWFVCRRHHDGWSLEAQ